MLNEVEWGEFKIKELFEVQKIKQMLSKDDLSKKISYPVYSSESNNGGVIGYTESPEFICNKDNPVYVIFGDHTRNLNISKKSFSVLDNVKVLLPKYQSDRILLFVISVWYKQIPNLGYARHWKVAKNCTLLLPTKNGQINLDFMEKFVAELEVQRIAELENYLSAAGLKDYTLTAKEERALADFELQQWDNFNLKKLFGAATRGKRLKSDDRISGDLPFVTAGEADTGISAFISNDVHRFKANTVTIDMFGSAKYRNYEYGADDHVAVVHTNELDKMAVLFITSAIHKAAYTGEFHYGRNFYAKDADNLMINLPVKDGKPDYVYMQTLISAVQKQVIKDVVLCADEKIAATKIITGQSE